MKYSLLSILLLALVAGCSATERGATVGGASGAAIGGAASGDVEGALVGGAVGAAAGAVIGQASEPGQCIYRDERGREYTAACP